MSLFARARANLSLSPFERAALKAVELGVIAGIVAAGPVLAQLFAQQQVNWLDAARNAGIAFATAFLAAVWKYLKSQGDGALTSVLLSAPATQNIAASAAYTTLAVAAPVVPAQPAILATESPDSAL